MYSNLICFSLFFFVIWLSVEQVESMVVEIVERSLEFCLLYLEKSSYECDDFGLLVSSFGHSVHLSVTL
jgi:E3 ubiquitin-protein ligase UBR4